MAFTLPLWVKIGVEQGVRLAAIGMPVQVTKLMQGVPPHQQVKDNAEVVWLFCPDADALAEGLPVAQAAMNPEGALWISWTKKGSRLWLDLTADLIREAAAAIDFVSAESCEVDEDWAALKFVPKAR